MMDLRLSEWKQVEFDAKIDFYASLVRNKNRSVNVVKRVDIPECWEAEEASGWNGRILQSRQHYPS